MASTNNTNVSSPQHEQQRAMVRQWAQSSWAEPCEAIFFRWKQFDLKKFSGREEIGTMSLWFKVGWTLALPGLLVYALIRYFSDELGITEANKQKSGPGVILVEGWNRNPTPTALIDTVKRAPRSLWLVVSRTRVAVIVAGKGDNQPRVVWQTDESATVGFQHAVPNSIQITWPDECRASFSPTIEERQVVTHFVRSTWNDHR